VTKLAICHFNTQSSSDEPSHKAPSRPRRKPEQSPPCKWETELKAYLDRELATTCSAASRKAYYYAARAIVGMTATSLATRYPTSKSQLISMQAEVG